jgi:hypothetical protein
MRFPAVSAGMPGYGKRMGPDRSAGGAGEHLEGSVVMGSTDDYAASPYPGRRPRRAFVQADRQVLGLSRRLDRSWGLAHPDLSLDDWLSERGEVGLQGRSPLLCYGSNACPGKLQQLRDRMRLPGVIVMTPCTLSGLAAAWCAGTRHLDGAVPATLVTARGSEQHFLWWVTPEQWPVLDRCEGAGARYELVVLAAEHVHDDLGGPVGHARAYVGVGADRQPLADGQGRPLLVRNVDQASARRALRASAAQR